MHSAWTERSRHHIHKGRIPPKIRALITRLLSAEKVGSLLWWVEKLWLSPVHFFYFLFFIEMCSLNWNLMRFLLMGFKT